MKKNASMLRYEKLIHPSMQCNSIGMQTIDTNVAVTQVKFSTIQKQANRHRLKMMI